MSWNQQPQWYGQDQQQMYASGGAKADPAPSSAGNNPYGSAGTIKCGVCRQRRKAV
jgi:hypothetical protein